MTSTASLDEGPACGSALMQNIPVPSGTGDGTRAIDQDLWRFYLRDHLRCFQGLFAPNTEAVRVICSRLCPETRYAPDTSVLTFVWQLLRTRHDLASCLGNWVSAHNLPADARPIQYIALGQDVSVEVLRFCVNKGILEYLRLALSLVKQHFHDVRLAGIRTEADPEVDDEWVTIDIEVGGDVDLILAEYDQYVAAWVQQVPFPQSQWIRLNYDVR